MEYDVKSLTDSFKSFETSLRILEEKQDSVHEDSSRNFSRIEEKIEVLSNKIDCLSDLFRFIECKQADILVNMKYLRNHVAYINQDYLVGPVLDKELTSDL